MGPRTAQAQPRLSTRQKKKLIKEAEKLVREIKGTSLPYLHHGSHPDLKKLVNILGRLGLKGADTTARYKQIVDKNNLPVSKDKFRNEVAPKIDQFLKQVTDWRARAEAGARAAAPALAQRARGLVPTPAQPPVVTRPPTPTPAPPTTRPTPAPPTAAPPTPSRRAVSLPRVAATDQELQGTTMYWKTVLVKYLTDLKRKVGSRSTKFDAATKRALKKRIDYHLRKLNGIKPAQVSASNVRSAFADIALAMDEGTTIHYLVALRNELERHSGDRKYNYVKGEINKAANQILLKEKKWFEAIREAVFYFGKLDSVKQAGIRAFGTQADAALAKMEGMAKLRAATFNLVEDLYRIRYLNSPMTVYQAVQTALTHSGLDRNSDLYKMADKLRQQNQGKQDPTGVLGQRTYAAALSALAVATLEQFIATPELWRKDLGDPNRAGTKAAKLKANLQTALTKAKEKFNREFSDPKQASMHPEMPADICFEAMHKAMPSIWVRSENAHLDRLITRKDAGGAGASLISALAKREMSTLSLIASLQDDSVMRSGLRKTLRQAGRKGPAAMVHEWVLLNKLRGRTQSAGTTTAPTDIDHLVGGDLFAEMKSYRKLFLIKRAEKWGFTKLTAVLKGASVWQRAIAQRDKVAKGYAGINPLSSGAPAKFTALQDDANLGFAYLQEDHVKELIANLNQAEAVIQAKISGTKSDAKKENYRKVLQDFREGKALLEADLANRSKDLTSGVVPGVWTSPHQGKKFFIDAAAKMEMTDKMPEPRPRPTPTPTPPALVSFFPKNPKSWRVKDTLRATCTVGVKIRDRPVSLSAYKKQYGKPTLHFFWYVFMEMYDGSIYVVNPRYTPGGKEPLFLGRKIGDTVFRIRYKKQPDTTMKDNWEVLRKAPPLFYTQPGTYKPKIDSNLRTLVRDVWKTPAFETRRPSLGGPGQTVPFRGRTAHLAVSVGEAVIAEKRK